MFREDILTSRVNALTDSEPTLNFCSENTWIISNWILDDCSCILRQSKNKI